MANRLSKIVTKTGDKGSTQLADGSRCNKNDIRIHCLGDIDELNSIVGVVIGYIDQKEIQELLLHIQHDLFDLGAELSQPGKQMLNEHYLDYLENQTQSLNDSLEPLKEFILPGGSPLLGYTHLARSICRRAERTLVELQQQQQGNPFSLKYLNRLSDLFFVLARYLAKQKGQKEIFWQSQYSRIKPS